MKLILNGVLWAVSAFLAGLLLLTEDGRNVIGVMAVLALVGIFAYLIKKVLSAAIERLAKLHKRFR